MIEINIGALVALMGIPTAVTGFCFWMLEHRIQKREKQKEAEEAHRQILTGKALRLIRRWMVRSMLPHCFSLLFSSVCR